jgi:hypothetical protein
LIDMQVGWAPVAKKVALFVLGFVALLPVASRVARWAAEFLSPVGRALMGRDDCISVTCTNVVLSGSEAALLQKRFQVCPLALEPTHNSAL